MEQKSILKINNDLTWEQENDATIEQIFQDFIKRACIFKENAGEKNSNISIELFLTANCNQKCEYCYLVKNRENLYPREIDQPEIILKNLQIFLQYLLKKEYGVKDIHLFSGEIWASDFGMKVFELLLSYCKHSKNPPMSISIPSNGSFILSEKYFSKIQTIIKNFEYYGTRLVFSISVDGPLLEPENRSFIDEKKNEIRNNEYYEQLFKFCEEHSYGFHPMVNAYSIEKWPEQYDWWIDKFNEYHFNIFQRSMFLEVRNDEWTKEKIISYLNFLNHAYEKVKKDIFDNNVENFIKAGLALPYEGQEKFSNYYNLGLVTTTRITGCSVDRSIIIRLGDLSWVPCHRTAYEKLVYGSFKVENNEIVGIKALNLPLLFSIYGLGYKGHPKCDVCTWNRLCLKGCYGAQFEAHKEIFYPCESVCLLFKVKNMFLYKKYLKDSITINNQECLNHLRTLSSYIDEKELNEWIAIVNRLL